MTMTGIEHALIEVLATLNRSKPLVVGSKEYNPCSSKDEEAINFMYKIVRDGLKEEREDPKSRYVLSMNKNNSQLYHVEVCPVGKPDNRLELNVTPKLFGSYNADITFFLEGEKRELLTRTHHKITPAYSMVVRECLRLPVEEGTKTRIPIQKP